MPSGFRSVALLSQPSSPRGTPLLQNADVIIGIGARFDDRVTGKIALFARGARAAAAAGEGGIIQFEISSKNINKAVPLRCAGVGWDGVVALFGLPTRLARRQHANRTCSLVDPRTGKGPARRRSTCVVPVCGVIPTYLRTYLRTYLPTYLRTADR